VKNTYKIIINCIETSKRQSACFETRSGVRQGSILSFNIILNNICNKIREKLKVTDLKIVTYADYVIIRGGPYKATRGKISPLGKRNQEFCLADKLGKDSSVKVVENR
jgi:hypothetical protein